EGRSTSCTALGPSRVVTWMARMPGKVSTRVPRLVSGSGDPGSMDLFGQQLLDTETHRAVFGDLPSSLQGHLRTTEVGDLVLQLLGAGWRRGRLASRIGALPAGSDPVAEITALLRGFLDQLPPDARWREERAQRDAVSASRAEAEQPASDASRRE